MVRRLPRRWTRRGVLEQGLILLALSSCPATAAIRSLARGSPKKSPKLISSWTEKFPKQDRRLYTAENSAGFLRSFDLATEELTQIEMDCWGHSFCQSPIQPSIVATTAKWNPYGGVVDLEKKKVVTKLVAPAGHRFYGHSAFSDDGILFASAVEDGSLIGSLLAIDPVTGQILRTIKTGGRSTHEFRFIDRETVITANSYRLDSQEALLSWISTKSGQILRQERIPSAAHVIPFDKGNSVVVGYPFGEGDRPGLFTFDIATKSVRPVEKSASFARRDFAAGETLSFCVLSDSIVVATSGNANRIVTWNLETNRMNEFKFGSHTLGLVQHEGRIWVSLADGKLIQFDIIPEAPYLKKRGEPAVKFANASHLLLASI